MGCGLQKIARKQIEYTQREENKTILADTEQNAAIRHMGRFTEEIRISSETEIHEDVKKRASQSIKIDTALFFRRNSKSLSSSYNLSRKIGEGNYGFVRLAIHKSTGEERAIKSIEKSKLSRNSIAQFKFFNEIDILKKLDHPNIIKIYEFFEDSQYFHLITEYISGGELLHYTLKLKATTEAIIANFMQQILSAVSYCHENAVTHGGIEPENILLDIDNSDITIKLIDFGTSTVIGSNSQSEKDKLNPLYTAPEILLGKNINEKCDIWSCGVILYLLLSGKPPFFGKNNHIIAERVISGEYTLKSPEMVKVSISAIDLITKMLEYNPNKRISAKDALNHIWIKESTQKVKSLETFETTNLDNLKLFKAGEKLQHAVLTFISCQILPREQLKIMTDNFRKVDYNGDGKLSRDEIMNAYLKVMNKERAIKTANIIMDKVDTDKSGFIDYSEFLTACLKKEDIIDQNSLDLAFQAFDTDSSGKITFEEIVNLLKLQADEQNDLKNMLIEIDRNSDGEIDLQEFKDMMIKYFS